jgi:hypothetical protein
MECSPKYDSKTERQAISAGYGKETIRSLNGEYYEKKTLLFYNTCPGDSLWQS